MKQYYYNFKGEQTGPVNIQEVISLVKDGIISHNTLVWYNGLTQWKNAVEVEEFENLFSSPPPLPLYKSENKKSEPENKTNPSTKKVVKRFLFLLILIPTLIFAINVFAKKLNNRNNQNLPQNFLKIEGIDHKVKLLKNDFVEGTVSNISDETTYGQVVLRLEWFDKNNSVISRTSHDLAEIVRPLGTKKFKIPTNSPLKGRTYQVTVNSARAIN